MLALIWRFDAVGCCGACWFDVAMYWVWLAVGFGAGDCSSYFCRFVVFDMVWVARLVHWFIASVWDIGFG